MLLPNDVTNKHFTNKLSHFLGGAFCRRNSQISKGKESVLVYWKISFLEISLDLFRALAHVIRHPASEHTDDIGLGQHYENMQTRVSANSLRKYGDVSSTKSRPAWIHLRMLPPSSLGERSQLQKSPVNSDSSLNEYKPEIGTLVYLHGCPETGEKNPSTSQLAISQQKF